MSQSVDTPSSVKLRPAAKSKGGESTRQPPLETATFAPPAARARSARDGRRATQATPVLSIVAPTYNERGNIRPLVEAIAASMGDTRWELIIVDDDSPDGTCQEVAAVAREGAPVRCIRRVGRRGLSSAVVEGVMSATADVVAVMDADLQHDERLLPRMLETLRTTDADLVVASRHVEGGGLGEWSAIRRRMSEFATWSSRILIGDAVSDPMSGFFMTRRAVFDAVVYDLSQQGYKILLDVLTSSPRQLKVVETPYVFRDRRSGESKVEAMIILEYAFLLIEKFSKGLIPPRFVLFAAVGFMGLAVHLAVLNAMKIAGLAFLPAQAVATLSAMTFNYVLNNTITYRTERLKGLRFLVGYVTFCGVCSLGAVANISVANLTMSEMHSWPLAGVAGALMSSVFNFGVANRLVWGRRRRPATPMVVQAAIA
ncbi:glycosyltransferase [Phenylobacterium deserti]|uniref:Glycosyltransferase family 2 protein n=1 Tax=Phenylobacterium deserti TaxID=1914756 RepID=A0A328ADD9_9CAUL|nr:glycosyltransferase family 2 protein [Phenylobacterium deserti]RAK52843.1 glycosyltransferase family 2 protein [Phenylobacterium deserti]